MIRAILPKHIDKSCLFYAKQGDSSFRGDFGILMAGNRPKPVYNMARVFNSLRGHWLRTTGTDDDVCAVAALDDDHRRLAVVVVNFRSRFPVVRQVQLKISNLPSTLHDSKWRVSTIDSNHSNLFTDVRRCELETAASGDVAGNPFVVDRTLLPNSITLFELVRN